MKRLIFLILTAISIASYSQVKIITTRVVKNKGVTQTTIVDSVTVASDTVSVPHDTCHVNVSPVANAGVDKSMTLPTNTVSITGIGTDADGTISVYVWSKVSGPSTYTITNSTSATTSFSNLVQGTYVFRFTVVDNGGASASDDVNVVVNANTGSYSLIYSNGFDVATGGASGLGDLDPFDHGQIGNGGLSTSTYVTGPGSFHSRPSSVSSGIRSEVQFESAQTPSEGAVEYDVLYHVIVPNNGHSLQWHPSTSGGSASPGLWFDGGKFSMVNWKSGTNTYHQTGITILVDHWYHIRVEYKFSSSGYVRLFIDGVQSTGGSWTGQVGDGSGPYLKVGYNGWDSNSTKSDIFYDNLQVFRLN